MRLDSAHSTPGGDGGFAITWRLPFYQGDRHSVRLCFFLYFRPGGVFAAARAFLELWRGMGWGRGLLSGCGGQVSHRGGFSCFRGRSLGHMGSAVSAPGLQSADAVVVAPGLSCSAARGIFPDRGWNWCLLHWLADS